jgi:hypothetical protein
VYLGNTSTRLALTSRVCSFLQTALHIHMLAWQQLHRGVGVRPQQPCSVVPAEGCNSAACSARDAVQKIQSNRHSAGKAVQETQCKRWSTSLERRVLRGLQAMLLCAMTNYVPMYTSAPVLVLYSCTESHNNHRACGPPEAVPLQKYLTTHPPTCNILVKT